MASDDVEFIDLDQKYKFKATLGEGSGGKVLRVEDLSGHTYALKLMVYRKDPRVLSAFNQSGILEEIGIGLLLNHPHIVKYDLVEFLEYKNKRYISFLEILENYSLQILLPLKHNFERTHHIAHI